MRYLLLLTPFQIACSSAEKVTDVDSESTVCAPVSGKYLQHWEERPGGECGPIPDMVIDADADNESGCIEEAETISPDRCTHSMTLRCGDMRTVSTCTWAKDGKSGRCVWNVDYRDNIHGICHSVYDTTFSKIR